MNAIYFDASFSDRERLEKLYAGNLFVFSPTSATRAFCEHAQEMITAAFKGRDPLTAQDEMEVVDFAAIVAPLKRSFIHHPRSKELIKEVLAEFDCDPERTYLDVPRLRISTHSNYMTSGVAYAHHPHRDTWYSAPLSQINWWLAIYDFSAESGMAFHPTYWEHGVANDSDRFDYYDWNSNGRQNAAQHVTSDTRFQPKAQEQLHLDPPMCLVPKKAGPILFSGAQLHSTIPNTTKQTRWSIDFRTVNIDDVIAHGGAPNKDSHPKGTSLRDFMRTSDLERLSEEIALTYDARTEARDRLLFAAPEESGKA
jgi:hypothetical protein